MKRLRTILRNNNDLAYIFISLTLFTFLLECAAGSFVTMYAKAEAFMYMPIAALLFAILTKINKEAYSRRFGHAAVSCINFFIGVALFFQFSTQMFYFYPKNVVLNFFNYAITFPARLYLEYLLRTHTVAAFIG